MRNFQAERIKDSAQGLCGLLDVLFDDVTFQGLDTDEKTLTADRFAKLLQSAKVLAHG